MKKGYSPGSVAVLSLSYVEERICNFCVDLRSEHDPTVGKPAYSLG
jgi:hypothetical protein